MTDRARVGGTVALSELDEAAALRAVRPAAARMPQVWDAMRLNQDGRVGRGRPVGHPGPRRPSAAGRSTRPTRSASCSCCCCCAQPRLRMVYVTSMPIAPDDRRVLPGAAAGRHPEPRPGAAAPGVRRTTLSAAAEREAAGAAPAAAADRATLIPDRARSPPRALQHHRARARPRARRWASRCTAPTPGWSSWAPRPAAGGCSPRRVSGTRSGRGPAHVGRRASTHCSRMRAQRPVVERSSSSSTRACPARATRSSTWPGCRRPGTAESARSCASGCGRCSSSDRTRRSTPTWRSSPSAAASSRSASPAPRCAARACSCGSCPHGEVELLSTHDQLLGGPSGQSYLGCRFPADFAYARAISGEAMTVGERLAREGVLGRFAHRLRRGPGRRRRLDAVRHRDQPAQGRHDPPVPHPAVPHRRPLRRRDRPVPDPGRRARSTSWPPTTSSRRRCAR